MLVPATERLAVFTWVYMYMALPNNMTKVFDLVFSKFALLIFKKQCLLVQKVKNLMKMHLTLRFTPTVDQQVIKINGYECTQHIMKAWIHKALKRGGHIC